MPIYISDNQKIMLCESANTKYLNKQSLWQPIRQKKTKCLTKQGDCASWKYTNPHNVFSKNTFRQETNKPKCLVSRKRPCFYTTTNNVAKPFHSTSHQFGIEVRPKNSVTWLRLTSGRPRKLKILYLQSPCKLIPLIYLRINTYAHSHVSCRTYWHFPPPYFISWLSIWGLWTGSKKRLNATIGDLYGWHSIATQLLTALAGLPITHFHLYSELGNMRLTWVNTKALYGVRRTAHRRTPTGQLGLWQNAVLHSAQYNRSMCRGHPT